ncbi:MAG TPA: acyltransferase [Armatimonadota bacterium]
MSEPSIRETRPTGQSRWSGYAFLHRFSRVTSSGSFIPEIDGLRFFAIATVIIFHINMYLAAMVRHTSPQYYLDPFYAIASQGFIGVQLFFALSGFILALPFASRFLKQEPAPNLKRYFLRRVTRLEPPYIINLLLFFVFLLPTVHRTPLFPHLLASLGYVHNLVYGKGSLINFVAWSLEVEVQFYLLAPLLTRLFLIRSVGERRLAFLLLIGVGIAFHHFSLSLLGQVQYFMVGFFLADVYLTEWQGRPKQHYAWDIYTALAMVGIVAVLQFEWNSLVLVPLLILVAYMGAFRGVWANRIVTHPLLVVIGGMCYTLYLYHEAVINMVSPLTTRLMLPGHYGFNLLTQSMLLFPPVIIICALLFLFLEKPFMYRDWPARWWAALRRKRV